MDKARSVILLSPVEELQLAYFSEKYENVTAEKLRLTTVPYKLDYILRYSRDNPSLLHQTMSLIKGFATALQAGSRENDKLRSWVLQIGNSATSYGKAEELQLQMSTAISEGKPLYLLQGKLEHNQLLHYIKESHAIIQSGSSLSAFGLISFISSSTLWGNAPREPTCTIHLGASSNQDHQGGTNKRSKLHYKDL